MRPAGAGVKRGLGERIFQNLPGGLEESFKGEFCPLIDMDEGRPPDLVARQALHTHGQCGYVTLPLLGSMKPPERGDRRASGVRSRSARSRRRPAAGFCQLNRAFAGSLDLM